MKKEFAMRVRLTELCASQGITIRQLADLLDLSDQTLYYWNVGRARPPLEHLINLSQFFRTDRLEDLVENKATDDEKRVVRLETCIQPTYPVNGMKQLSLFPYATIKRQTSSTRTFYV